MSYPHIPTSDIHLMAILAGLKGYPDDDTERAVEVLRNLAQQIPRLAELGWGLPEVGAADGITVGRLRQWCEERIGTDPA